MAASMNGSSTVTNDGLHAATSATGTVTVTDAGRYPISVTYFEKDGEQTMQLYWSGPGISRQLVPGAAFTATNSASMVAVSTTGNLPVNAVKKDFEILPATKIYPNPFVEGFRID
jgi:hypothetical protein